MHQLDDLATVIHDLMGQDFKSLNIMSGELPPGGDLVDYTRLVILTYSTNETAGYRYHMWAFPYDADTYNTIYRRIRANIMQDPENDMMSWGEMRRWYETFTPNQFPYFRSATYMQGTIRSSFTVPASQGFNLGTSVIRRLLGFYRRRDVETLSSLVSAVGQHDLTRYSAGSDSIVWNSLGPLNLAEGGRVKLFSINYVAQFVYDPAEVNLIAAENIGVSEELERYLLISRNLPWTFQDTTDILLQTHNAMYCHICETRGLEQFGSLLSTERVSSLVASARERLAL